jgi:protoporphyrinogen oxidase
MERPIFKAIIVGAGPAGLTAAYELSKQQAPVVVLESDPQYVGGISRTVNYKNFRFDIGGHRFFSKSREVEDFWTEIAGETCSTVPGRRAFTIVASSTPIR